MPGEAAQKKGLSSTALYTLLVVALLLLCAGVMEVVQPSQQATVPEIPETAPLPAALSLRIVLDAGHGGMDGGAVGKTTGVHEDVLNLDVAQKLQKLLTDAGATVIMTRETGEAIAKTKDSDMIRRREIISTSSPDMVVSIHMNFFSDTRSAGPQVFYYETSPQGRELAKVIQAKMNEILQPLSPRVCMKGDYFILRSGEAPAVIVECGFLSNAREEALLCDEPYRQKVAQSVLEGIRSYTDARKPVTTENLS